LTAHELQRFADFKQDYIHEFKEGDEDHEAALRALFELVFSEAEQATANENMKA